MSAATMVLQRNAALDRANAVRRERASWKLHVRNRPRPDALRMAVILVHYPPPWAMTWRAHDLLTALPRVGERNATRALMVCDIRDTRVLGSLTDRQRKELCLWLELRASLAEGP